MNISNQELRKEVEVNISNQQPPGCGESVYPSFKANISTLKERRMTSFIGCKNLTGGRLELS